MDDDTPTNGSEQLPGPFEVKAFEFKLEEVSEEGEFSGFAAVYGNMDSGGDIIEPGAFKRSIRQRKRVPVLWQHLSREPIGVSVELEETEQGLKTRGRLVLSVQRAKEAHELLKARALDGLSIGYGTVKAEILRDDQGTFLGRRLKELKLWEYSLVTFPMNELALVGDVKGIDIERLSAALTRLRETDPDLVKQLLAGGPADATRPSEQEPGPADATLRSLTKAAALAIRAVDISIVMKEEMSR